MARDELVRKIGPWVVLEGLVRWQSRAHARQQKGPLNFPKLWWPILMASTLGAL